MLKWKNAVNVLTSACFPWPLHWITGRIVFSPPSVLTMKLMNLANKMWHNPGTAQGIGIDVWFLYVPVGKPISEHPDCWSFMTQDGRLSVSQAHLVFTLHTLQQFSKDCQGFHHSRGFDHRSFQKTQFDDRHFDEVSVFLKMLYISAEN